MKDSSEQRIKEAASLESMGRDLTSLAESGKLGLVYEREKEIKALASLLASGNNNVLLVGESGVGKNAIIEGLSQWITLASSKDELSQSDWDVYVASDSNRIIIKKKNGNTAHTKYISSNLMHKRIIETSADAFQYGCFYMHEFENKLKIIIEECKKHNAILFLDNINMVIHAGKTNDSSERSLANLMKRYLSGKELTVVGATTPEGYESILKANPDFINHFVKLDVVETSADKTKKILRELKDSFEEKAKVSIDNEALDSTVELSQRFFPDRRLPGKAFELLNETISWQILDNRTVGKKDIYDLIQRKTGFPAFIIHRDKPVKREEVTGYFQEKVYGQDHAIEAVADSILAYKTELNDPNKPVSTFLFAGPTGVGKTELAKSLAKYLFGSKYRLHKYDMPNYADERGISRLIEGKSFRNEPGQLISDTIANPYCVILFDEIEKAHSDIYNLLLPVFDEGVLVDPVGRTAYFKNSIIIMTSNLGSELYQKKSIGLSPDSSEVTDNDLFNKIKQSFSPEFINRLTDIIYFKPLSKKDVTKIVRKELSMVFSRSGFRWRNLQINADEKVIGHIIEKGYSEDYGARAIQRTIQEEILYPLAAFLSNAGPTKGRTFYLTLENDQINLLE